MIIIFLAIAVHFPLLAGGSQESTYIVSNLWSGKLKTGLSMDWGNTECTDITGGFSAKRRTKIDDVLKAEYFFSGDFRYKKKSQIISENRGWGQAAYRRYLNDLWSLQITERLEYDKIKCLELGSLSLFSIEYWITKNEKTTFLINSGLGYLYKKFTDKKESSPTVTFGGEYTRKIREDIHMANILQVIIPLDMLNNYSCRNQLKIHYDFSENWGMEGSHRWEYFNSPSAGKKHLDQTLDLSAVYKF